jgi:hypothetical protein
MDNTPSENPIVSYGFGKTYIYSGNMNGRVTYFTTDSKYHDDQLILYFVKENGLWKIDFIQMLKTEVDKLLQ